MKVVAQRDVLNGAVRLLIEGRTFDAPSNNSNGESFDYWNPTTSEHNLCLGKNVLIEHV